MRRKLLSQLPDVIDDTRDVTSLPDEDPPGEIINET